MSHRDQIGREFLHTPGPTQLPERVLAAMHHQPYDLADPRFLELAASCHDDLKPVFGTTADVIAYAANGHGGWEAALANLCAPGELVLVPECGHFSRHWAEQARMLGLEVTGPVAANWRRAVDPAMVEAALRADSDRRIKAVLIVHTDTATGCTSDLEAIRAAIDRAGHPALYVVDAIASLGAVPFEMDQWGIDVAIAASQKALMGPPGLAFNAVAPRALAAADANPRRRYYWDWRRRMAQEMYLRFCGTTPEHLVFGLREALDIIAETGLDAIFGRHRRVAGAVEAAAKTWAEAGAIEINATEPAERAVTVTTILHEPGSPAAAMRDFARARLGVALGGGFGDLAGKVFRIGHMGWVNEPMILGCLGAVEAGFIELGVPHGPGGVRRAAEYLAATAPPQPHSRDMRLETVRR